MATVDRINLNNAINQNQNDVTSSKVNNPTIDRTEVLATEVINPQAGSIPAIASNKSSILSRISQSAKNVLQESKPLQKNGDEKTKKRFYAQIASAPSKFLNYQASRESGWLRWMGLKITAFATRILMRCIPTKYFSGLENLSDMSVSLNQTLFPEIKSQILTYFKDHPQKEEIEAELSKIEASKTGFDLIYSYIDLLNKIGDITKEDRKTVQELKDLIFQIFSQKGAQRLETFSKILTKFSTLTFMEKHSSAKDRLNIASQIIDKGVELVDEIESSLKPSKEQAQAIKAQIKKIKQEPSLLKQCQNFKIGSIEIGDILSEYEEKFANLSPEVASLIDRTEALLAKIQHYPLVQKMMPQIKVGVDCAKALTPLILSKAEKTLTEVHQFNENLIQEIDSKLGIVEFNKKTVEIKNLIKEIRKDEISVLKKIKLTSELLRKVEALKLPEMKELQEVLTFAKKELARLYPSLKIMLQSLESLAGDSKNIKDKVTWFLKTNDNVQQLVVPILQVGRGLFQLTPFVLKSTHHNILSQIDAVKTDVKNDPLLKKMKDQCESLQNKLEQFTSKELNFLEKLAVLKDITHELQKFEIDEKASSEDVQQIYILFKEKMDFIQNTVTKELEMYDPTFAEKVKGLSMPNIDVTSPISKGAMLGDHIKPHLQSTSESLEDIDEVNASIALLRSSETSFREKIKAADTFVEQNLLKGNHKLQSHLKLPIMEQAVETLLHVLFEMHIVNGYVDTLANPSRSIDSLKEKVIVVQNILGRVTNTVDSMKKIPGSAAQKEKLSQIARQLKEGVAFTHRLNSTLDNWIFKFIYNHALVYLL